MEKYITFVMHFDFFRKYHRDLKECKGDALHSCLNSKFDDLKQFSFKRFQKSLPILWNIWNFSQMQNRP